MAFRIVVAFRAANLVESQAHESEVSLARVDLFHGGQLDPARDAFADASGTVQDELARHRAVARVQEFLSADVVKGMAPLGSGQPKPIDGIERIWGRARVGRETTEIDAERH